MASDVQRIEAAQNGPVNYGGVVILLGAEDQLTNSNPKRLKRFLDNGNKRFRPLHNTQPVFCCLTYYKKVNTQTHHKNG